MENDTEQRLLEEGAKYYVGALNALAEFRRLIQAKCRKVFTRQLLEEHNSKLKISGKKIRVEDWASKERYWDKTETNLSVMIRIPDSADCLYYGLWFRKDQESPSITIHAFASIWLSSSETIRALLAALDKINPKLEQNEEDEHDFYLSKIVAPNEMATFDQALEQVVSEWIQVWDRIGGYPALSVTK